MTLSVQPRPTDRRDGIVRLLTETPGGLSDADLARRLGPEVRPQTVNTVCRRLVAEGVVERTGTRPILNRLVPAKKKRTRRPRTNGTAPAPASPGTDEATAAPATLRRRAGSTAANGTGSGHGTGPKARSTTPATSPAAAAPVETPVEVVAEVVADTVDGPSEDAPAIQAPADQVDGPTENDPADRLGGPSEDAPVAGGRPEIPARGDEAPGAAETPVHDEVPAPAEAPAPIAEEQHDAEPPPAAPRRDVLQGWSRTVNVRAAVADWLTGRGGTHRAVAGDGRGPASDLVVSLDGDDVHVEVTGWPPDGVRTHTTTIAGDWFAAAETAAAQRRRRHPDARIVIALPDTRRYRTLAEHRAGALAGSRAEVWFVDPTGVVAPH